MCEALGQLEQAGELGEKHHWVKKGLNLETTGASGGPGASPGLLTEAACVLHSADRQS